MTFFHPAMTRSGSPSNLPGKDDFPDPLAKSEKDGSELVFHQAGTKAGMLAVSKGKVWVGRAGQVKALR